MQIQVRQIVLVGGLFPLEMRARHVLPACGSFPLTALASAHILLIPRSHVVRPSLVLHSSLTRPSPSPDQPHSVHLISHTPDTLRTAGPLAAPLLTRWIATHSVSLVQVSQPSLRVIREILAGESHARYQSVGTVLEVFIETLLAFGIHVRFYCIPTASTRWRSVSSESLSSGFVHGVVDRGSHGDRRAGRLRRLPVAP